MKGWMNLHMSDLSQIDLTQKTQHGVDLSREVIQVTIDLYALINQITNDLGVSYVVIGATARDLVLHHGFGAPIKRATTDIDFGMQVENWDGFEKIKNALVDNGFVTTKNAHRLEGPKNAKIDVVPFGKLKDKSSNIKWPPKGDIEMSVLGFQEAHDNSINVILQKNPLVEIPVATPQGVTLLKIIAWADREASLKKKDAEDLVYLLEKYERVSEVSTKIYNTEGLMDQYDYDLALGSAHQLGIDAALISDEVTKKHILEILDNNLKTDNPSELVIDMCGLLDGEYEEKLRMLQAFANGFKN